MSDILVTPGFADSERNHVAALYWEAFQQKLRHVMGPEARALAFFAQIMSPDHALTARDPSGRLLGLAGVKTAEGALTQAGIGDMIRHYGLSGIWRGVLISVLEREVEPGILLMDGICVDPAARGRGVGTALLDGIDRLARARNCGRVRLDVIDTNPRARALYEQRGFVAVGEERTGPLRPLFGFDRATRMHKILL